MKIVDYCVVADMSAVILLFTLLAVLIIAVLNSVNLLRQIMYYQDRYEKDYEQR